VLRAPTRDSSNAPAVAAGGRSPAGFPSAGLAQAIECVPVGPGSHEAKGRLSGAG